MKNSIGYKQLTVKTLLVAWLLGLFGLVSSAGPNALSVSITGGQLSASSSDPNTISIDIRVAGPGDFLAKFVKRATRHPGICRATHPMGRIGMMSTLRAWPTAVPLWVQVARVLVPGVIA